MLIAKLNTRTKFGIPILCTKFASQPIRKRQVPAPESELRLISPARNLIFSATTLSKIVQPCGSSARKCCNMIGAKILGTNRNVLYEISLLTTVRTIWRERERNDMKRLRWCKSISLRIESWRERVDASSFSDFDEAREQNDSERLLSDCQFLLTPIFFPSFQMKTHVYQWPQMRRAVVFSCCGQRNLAKGVIIATDKSPFLFCSFFNDPPTRWNTISHNAYASRRGKKDTAAREEKRYRGTERVKEKRDG